MSQVEPAFRPPRSPLPLPDAAIREWLPLVRQALREVSGLTPDKDFRTSTARIYGYMLDQFEAVAGSMPIQPAEPPAPAFLEHLRTSTLPTPWDPQLARARKPSTIQHIMRVVSFFYETVQETQEANGQLPVENPVPVLLEKLRKKRKSRRNRAVDQFERRAFDDHELGGLFLLSVHAPRDFVVFVLLSKLGLRLMELLGTRVGSFCLDDPLPRVYLPRTGKRRFQFMFLDEETCHLVRWYLEWLANHLGRPLREEDALFWTQPRRGRFQPMGRLPIETALTRRMLKLRLQRRRDPPELRLVPHSIRFWWTSILEEAGLSTHEIERLRGDAPTGMVGHYSRSARRAAARPERALRLREKYLAAIPKVAELVAAARVVFSPGVSDIEERSRLFAKLPLEPASSPPPRPPGPSHAPWSGGVSVTWSLEAKTN